MTETEYLQALEASHGELRAVLRLAEARIKKTSFGTAKNDMLLMKLRDVLKEARAVRQKPGGPVTGKGTRRSERKGPESSPKT